MQKEEDFTLIKDFNSGEEKAFIKIVEKYKNKIYWHALKLLGNHYEADDVTQEVLIAMYNGLQKFSFNSSLYTWIFRITYTRSINYIRKKKVKQFFSLEDVKDNIVDKFDFVKDFESKEKLKNLNKVLDGLTIKQREVFILRRYEELSYEEISQITGKSIGGLKSIYHFTMNKILEKMKNNEQ